MRYIFALISIIFICSVSDSATAEPVTPSASVVRPSGVAYYTCSVEGIDASRRPVSIVSDVFEVPAVKGKYPTKDEVSNIFRWSMRMKNPDIYEASIAKGGFYANCLPYASKELARKNTIYQRNRFHQELKKIIWVGRYEFNNETFLLWQESLNKYRTK